MIRNPYTFVRPRRKRDCSAEYNNLMFDTLSGRLSQAVAALRGRGRLTEENVADTLRQVRLALLEADVALPVVKAFTEAARQRALGAEVTSSLTPGQAFVKILHDELTRVLGNSGRELNLRAQPPVVILLAGLQGAGKTTTAAKLAKFLVGALAARPCWPALTSTGRRPSPSSNAWPRRWVPASSGRQRGPSRWRSPARPVSTRACMVTRS